MIRNDPNRIEDGINKRIIRAKRKHQEWKYNALKYWRLIVLGYFAAAIIGCIDLENCRPQADESPFDHGYHIVITSDVSTDSCTICGKSPQ